MYWLQSGVRHGIDHEPTGDLLEPSARGLLLRKLRVGRVEGLRRVATAKRRLRPHKPLHLGRGEEHEGLPLADAAHAVGRLGEVAEGEIGAERQHGARARRLRDVHARRVDLRACTYTHMHGEARQCGIRCGRRAGAWGWVVR